jgi:hypothetical protein
MAAELPYCHQEGSRRQATLAPPLTTFCHTWDSHWPLDAWLSSAVQKLRWSLPSHPIRAIYNGTGPHVLRLEVSCLPCVSDATSHHPVAFDLPGASIYLSRIQPWPQAYAGTAQGGAMFSE